MGASNLLLSRSVIALSLALSVSLCRRFSERPRVVGPGGASSRHPAADQSETCISSTILFFFFSHWACYTHSMYKTWNLTWLIRALFFSQISLKGPSGPMGLTGRGGPMVRAWLHVHTDNNINISININIARLKSGLSEIRLAAETVADLYACHICFIFFYPFISFSNDTTLLYASDMYYYITFLTIIFNPKVINGCLLTIKCH